MRMATKPKMFRLDEEVLDAFDRYCASLKERPTAVVQRLMIQAMKPKGYWPPKQKDAK